MSKPVNFYQSAIWQQVSNMPAVRRRVERVLRTLNDQGRNADLSQLFPPSKRYWHCHCVITRLCPSSSMIYTSLLTQAKIRGIKLKLRSRKEAPLFHATIKFFFHALRGRRSRRKRFKHLFLWKGQTIRRALT